LPRNKEITEQIEITIKQNCFHDKWQYIYSIKKKKTFIVNNTCAFDTILSVICIGYYDFPKYKNYIENMNTEFLLFCKSIAIHGASTKDYHKRYELLKMSGILERPNYEVSGVQCYDAQCNIQNLIKQLKVISGKKVINCDNCSVIKDEYLNLLSPNMKILGTQGFNKETLETEINKYLSTRQELCNLCCNYMETMYEVEPHIFIDVDLLGYYGDANCKISSIPTTIMISKKQ